MSHPTSIFQETDEEKHVKDIKFIIKTFQSLKGSNFKYCQKYFICNYIFNFMTLLGACLFTNHLLHGKFYTYGSDYLTYYFTEDRHDLVSPTEEVFPKMTKCNYRRFGTSGSIEKNTALCTIPLNILNEKAFAVLYFVYLFLGIALLIGILHRIAVFIAPKYRIGRYSSNFTCERKKIQELDQHLSISDWFILSQIKKNVSSENFFEILQQLIIEKRKKYNNGDENYNCVTEINGINETKRMPNIEKGMKMVMAKTYKKADI